MRIAGERLLHRTTLVLGVIALALVTANSVLLVGNQRGQDEINRRQAFINQSMRLARLNQELVNTLTQVAVKRKDDALRALLAANGVTINVNAPAAATPASKPSTK